MLKNNSLILIILFLFLSNDIALAKLEGAEGTFRNIETALNQAVDVAERIFEENNGFRMGSKYNLVDKTKNPYLEILEINADYVISIKLKNIKYRNRRNKNLALIPVAPGLLGAEILLVPIYNKGDEKITAWWCVTNVDKQVRHFIGSSGTKSLTASLIRKYTTNPYLSLCVFIDYPDLITNDGKANLINVINLFDID